MFGKKKTKKKTFVCPSAGRKDIVKKNILGDAFKDKKWTAFGKHCSNNKVAENSKQSIERILCTGFVFE